MSVRVGLVHSPPAGFPSGGDLYDSRLLEHAGDCGFSLHPLPWRDGLSRDDALFAQGWDLLVWDSLLLAQCMRIANERVALLLHWLPSLDPALDAVDRTALQSVERRALAHADFVIAAGKPVADAVSAIGAGKPVFVCEPGVENVFRLARARPAVRRESVQLLTVAHLLPAKGHALLLEMLRPLAPLEWQWHLVGDCQRSPETARDLCELAVRSGLADRLTFHGALGQQGVAALMACSDLFIFASRFEAYGMALAEAVAAGLPVLRTPRMSFSTKPGISANRSSGGGVGAFKRFL